MKERDLLTKYGSQEKVDKLKELNSRGMWEWDSDFPNDPEDLGSAKNSNVFNVEIYVLLASCLSSKFCNIARSTIIIFSKPAVQSEMQCSGDLLVRGHGKKDYL